LSTFGETVRTTFIEAVIPTNNSTQQSTIVHSVRTTDFATNFSTDSESDLPTVGTTICVPKHAT
jgi:hypothetical protein